MRSRLSYYSVILLVGLAMTSGLLLAMNPFSSPPASASAPVQGTSPAGGVVATNSTVSSASTPTPGGVFAGAHHHHHDAEFPGAESGAGNSTVTTPSGVYSDHE